MTPQDIYIAERKLERCEVEGHCSGCDTPTGGSWVAAREDSGVHCFVCGGCISRLAEEIEVVSFH